MFKSMQLAAGVAVLLLSGAAAGAANAQSAQSLSGLRVRAPEARVENRAPEDNRFGPVDASKQLQLNSRRWGLKLNLDQPVGRDARSKDVEAGAYYRITPSLRVGGAVRLDETAEGVRRITPRDQQPRVRLETAFQF